MNKLLLLVAGCWLLVFPAHATEKSTTEKLKVIASFSIIGDMVHEIAGDNVDLTVLVGANGDAHEYEPTPADAKKMATADIIFNNGLGFESWLTRHIKTVSYRGKMIVVSNGIAPLTMVEDGHNQQDPHAWQDLSNGKIYAQNIKDALIAADAKNAKIYEENAKDYIKKLDDLDKKLKAEFAKIPAEKRKVITTHDAFGYFAKAYSVEFLALQGVSTQSQPSAKDMARLIDQIRTQKINTIFLENMADSRLIKQLEKDAGAKIGGTLYSDALSAENEPANHYTTMFEHNLQELTKAMK